MKSNNISKKEGEASLTASKQPGCSVKPADADFRFTGGNFPKSSRTVRSPVLNTRKGSVDTPRLESTTLVANITNDHIGSEMGNVGTGANEGASQFSSTKPGASNGGANIGNVDTIVGSPFGKKNFFGRAPAGIQRSMSLSMSDLSAPRGKEITTETREVPSNISKLEVVKKHINDLANYVQDRNNVHGEIKRLVRMIKLSYNEVEKQFQVMTARAEISEVTLGIGNEKPILEPEPNSIKFSEVVRRGNRQLILSEVLDNSKLVSKRRRDSPPQNESQVGNKKRNTVSAMVPTSRKPAIIPIVNLEEEGVDNKSEWQKVGPRRRKRRRRRPPRPDALLIKKKGEGSYADLLRKVKMDAGLTNLGDKVTHIRQTAKGDLLLELDSTGDQNRTVDFQAQLVKSIGEEAEVKTLIQGTLVEIKDIDEVTSSNDILTALETLLVEAKDVSTVKSLKPSYRGTQRAVVSLPSKIAEELVEKGKIRIGWVICRVRELIEPVKCFKCLGYGHQAHKCNGRDDRSKLCRKCGQEGHIAKDCKNNPRCLLCNEEVGGGNKHATGSSKCPAYQKALQMKIRR